MVATLLPQPRSAADLPRRADPPSAHHHTAPTRLETPPRAADPEAERRRQARDLVAAVDGSREALEELRAGFLRRLHRASDDFGATEGLRVTEAALRLVPPLADLWTGHERAGQVESESWWRRLRPRKRRRRRLS